ncbi:uncharacterized protein BO80DRAFT_64458 [Aspergillus ibericus CBS 121593]|uniref:Arrestin-like N-terminal domain-containing protein n=1 Tax=Aspergillus ibericus CBS 121593 TaxID=1448316 RepID=A0A395H106_9EURO|nr:hypothetical protein BO80DRAFT_64458 [Aspergillus ibericus CBS 121593]RAL01293.1 hypothetical protein BO80DRAFT_64458 [Aspergillus ibericus CBS 121593]
MTRGVHHDGMPAVTQWILPLAIHSPRPERAPVLVPEDSKFYCLTRKKLIPKSLFSLSQNGILSARATQPTGIQQRESAIRYIPVDLQYLAISEQHLPQLSLIRVRLNAITIFGEKPQKYLPEAMGSSVTDLYRRCREQRELFVCSAPGPLEWQKHFADDRDMPDVDTIPKQNYNASMRVPIKFPENLNLPSSFSCCLVSRIYSLTVTLQFRIPGQWSKMSRLALTVPLQIC